MVLSPVMKYVVDREPDYPSPSEADKLKRTVTKYRKLLRERAGRPDINELKFGLADLLVGRNEAGDYEEAMRLYDELFAVSPEGYLKARVRVGKAELLINSSNRGNIDQAIELTEKAFTVLRGDLSNFFTAKALTVEAELRIKRADTNDHHQALKLLDKVINKVEAHWYFRGRAMVDKAEAVLIRTPRDLPRLLKLCDDSGRLFKERPDDYFALKGKLIKAELLMRRKGPGDGKRAEKLLGEVTESSPYRDLIARAKLDLVDILEKPQAEKVYGEVMEMEGLDPYLIEKAKMVKEGLKART